MPEESSYGWHCSAAMAFKLTKLCTTRERIKYFISADLAGPTESRNTQFRKFGNFLESDQCCTQCQLTFHWTTLIETLSNVALFQCLSLRKRLTTPFLDWSTFPIHRTRHCLQTHPSHRCATHRKKSVKCALHTFEESGKILILFRIWRR